MPLSFVQTKAWVALSVVEDHPTICPEALMPKALLEAPPSVPKSCMPVFFVHRKACEFPSPLSEDPTTWPRALAEKAKLVLPPSVPRSVIVYTCALAGSTSVSRSHPQITNRSCLPIFSFPRFFFLSSSLLSHQVEIPIQCAGMVGIGAGIEVEVGDCDFEPRSPKAAPRAAPTASPPIRAYLPA